MSNWLTTFTITFGLFFLALLGLLISWLVKGEKFKGGSCGKRPGVKKDDSCGKDPTCMVCNPPKEENKGPRANRFMTPQIPEEGNDDDRTD